MKKLTLLAAAAVAGVMAASVAVAPVAALAEETSGDAFPKTFFDDFESYDLGFTEDVPAVREKWDNEKLAYLAGDDTKANDTECTETISIAADPLDGGNKTLKLSTAAGSFGYIGPKDIKTRDFDVEFDAYLPAVAGWFGLAVRKDSNVRWNGCNNVMLTYNPRTSTETGKDSLLYVGYRNRPSASPTTIDDTEFDDLQNYSCDSSDSGFLGKWAKYKAVVRWNEETETTDYSLYITPAGETEAHCLGTMHYTTKAKTTDVAGYVSLVFCVTTVYVDNFTMTYYDEGTDSSGGEENEEIAVTAIAISKAKASLAAGGTLQLSATIYPAGATDQSVTWTSDNEAVATVSGDGLVTAVGEGTAVITVTSVNNPAKSAVCTVTVTAESGEESSSSSGGSSASSSTGSGGGCGSSVSLAAAGLLTAACAGFVCLKRRR